MKIQNTEKDDCHTKDFILKHGLLRLYYLFMEEEYILLSTKFCPDDLSLFMYSITSSIKPKVAEV